MLWLHWQPWQPWLRQLRICVSDNENTAFGFACLRVMVATLDELQNVILARRLSAYEPHPTVYDMMHFPWPDYSPTMTLACGPRL